MPLSADLPRVVLHPKIDLLGGDLQYKREFGTVAHPTVDIVACPTKSAARREGLVAGALNLYRRFSRS